MGETVTEMVEHGRKRCVCVFRELRKGITISVVIISVC